MISGSEAINQIDSIKRKNQVKITKSKILIKFKNRDFPPNSKSVKAGPIFLTFKAKLVFTQLKQAFVEVPIFYHFDLEYYT